MDVVVDVDVVVDLDLDLVLDLVLDLDLDLDLDPVLGLGVSVEEEPACARLLREAGRRRGEPMGSRSWSRTRT